MPENVYGGGTSSLEVMVDVWARNLVVTGATAAAASTCTVGAGDSPSFALRVAHDVCGYPLGYLVLLTPVLLLTSVVLLLVLFLKGDPENMEESKASFRQKVCVALQLVEFGVEKPTWRKELRNDDDRILFRRSTATFSFRPTSARELSILARAAN